MASKSIKKKDLERDIVHLELDLIFQGFMYFENPLKP